MNLKRYGKFKNKIKIINSVKNINKFYDPKLPKVAKHN